MSNILYPSSIKLLIKIICVFLLTNHKTKKNINTNDVKKLIKKMIKQLNPPSAILTETEMQEMMNRYQVVDDSIRRNRKKRRKKRRRKRRRNKTVKHLKTGVISEYQININRIGTRLPSTDNKQAGFVFLNTHSEQLYILQNSGYWSYPVKILPNIVHQFIKY